MPSDRQDWSEPTLGFLVHDVARLLRKRLEQRARAAGIGLTRAQWQTLAYLARSEGMNQASLAQLLGNGADHAGPADRPARGDRAGRAAARPARPAAAQSLPHRE